MNRKGFTLIELLATIVIIGIIMSLVFPSAVRMNNENDLRICQEYETMMEEYARVNFNKVEDYIDLIELEELDKIKSECDGYVIIDHSTNPVTYKAYVSCPNGCKTEGYQEKDSRMVTIIIKANDITTTYLENIPSFSYNMESSVDLLGANPLTSVVTYKVVDSKGDVVEVNSNTPAGEYTIIPSTTVKSKYRLVIQDGTLTINKIQCSAPTNVDILSSGIITWTGSSNCPESHQLRINDGEWEVATSGVNKKSVLVSSPGKKKVFIKALAPNSNYSDSEDATNSRNVYSVTLKKGSEISSVTGSGNYIKGETVTISATQNSGKIWNHWIDTNTSEEISTNQTYFATISSDWNYTAVAYNKLNNAVTITKKTCNYSGSGCAATVTATSGTPTIKYYTNNSCTSGESSSAPVNAGTYYAIASVAESTTYFAANSACTEAVTINKIDPTLTLSASSGNVGTGLTTTFTEKANIKGTFSVNTSSATYATVTHNASGEIAANTEKTVTVTGVSYGSATITVTFTPTDSTNYNTKTGTYSVTVIQHCNAGYYLPKNTTRCEICPKNNYCIGGTWSKNTTSDQGKTACANGYTTNGTGKTKKGDCCTTNSKQCCRQGTLFKGYCVNTNSNVGPTATEDYKWYCTYGYVGPHNDYNHCPANSITARTSGYIKAGETCDCQPIYDGALYDCSTTKCQT